LGAPEDSIFSKIVAKTVPADIVYEDERALAFKDKAPVAPTHILIIPKKPIKGIGALVEEDEAIVGHCLVVARKVAEKQGLGEGYRLVVNEGKHGQQTVPWLHVHLIGGKQLHWPPTRE
jgi:histidine triad (HIT) family protein